MKKFLSTFTIAVASMATYINLYLNGYRGKAFLIALIAAFIAGYITDTLLQPSKAAR